MTRESLLAVVFVTGSARAFEQTTMQTLLPGHRAAAAVVARHRGRRLGDAGRRDRRSGGRRLALRGRVPILVYALCCALYFTSSMLIGMVKIERTRPSREPLSVAVLFAGFAYIRHNPVMLGVISLDLFAVHPRRRVSRCCRCSRATCSMPGRGASACCARRPASAR